MAIAVEFILGHSQKRGPVCKNLSSSRAVDDIASKYGCQVYSTPVGEIHVCQLAIHFATLFINGCTGTGRQEDERSPGSDWR